MRKKIFEKQNPKNDEAFEEYLYVIGTNINELNEQMKEVD